VLHGAPKDSHTSTQTYLVANDEEEVANWIDKEKKFGDWFDNDNDYYADDDYEKPITFREWVMLNKGDLDDEEGWEDAYYGVTKWGWKHIEATQDNIETLLRLGIARR
tara:strand:+ start:8727 stop:9050 length:324 start_codon:yes stop_codon:yes gene_type:complete